TSLSWLLPVELSPDGKRVLTVHYDKAIAPAAAHEEYGIEDPRISLIDGVWYMTTCAVSAPRLGTELFISRNGIDYQRVGLVLDHQNKDMLLFEGKIGGRFHALTRPLGDVYFAYPEDSEYRAGPAIHLAQSPDGIHWRPLEQPCLRPRKTSSCSRIGGG